MKRDYGGLVVKRRHHPETCVVGEHHHLTLGDDFRKVVYI